MTTYFLINNPTANSTTTKTNNNNNNKTKETSSPPAKETGKCTKLPDLISNTKPLLPPPAFNYRSPFDFTGINNGPFGRVPPSSNTAFGSLGSLFPPPPPPPPSSLLSSSSSSTIDRKSDINGLVAAAANHVLDWSRFHRGIGSSPLIPPLTSHSSINDSLLSKKPDEAK